MASLLGAGIISQAQYLQIVQYINNQFLQNQGVRNMPIRGLQSREIQLSPERQNLGNIVVQLLFEGDRIRHERD